jgi:hypothetical protein
MSSSSNDPLVCLAAVRLAFPLFISGIFTGLTYFGCTNPVSCVSAVFRRWLAVTVLYFFVETNDLNGKNATYWYLMDCVRFFDNYVVYIIHINFI